MDDGDLMDKGREAYRRNAWSEAHDLLSAAHRRSPLAAQDLELLSVAASMLDRQEEAAALREQAHNLYLDAGDVERAARLAAWNGLYLLQGGNPARAGGWLSKAHRLINEPYRDCVEHGYLLVPKGLNAMGSGDLETGLEAFSEALRTGERFKDPDLTALARHARGRTLIGMGEVQAGVALLDEAMLEATTTPGILPVVTGIVYCSVIDACRGIFDFRRAQEWTSALDAWSAGQPTASPFRSQCLVFRSEFKSLHGQWTEALEEAALASARLSEPPPHAAAGAAFYQQGDIHRLLGEFDAAEAAYRRAAELGHSVHPGVALLRLAQGNTGSAEAAIRREMGEATEPQHRSRLLPAYVEILVAAGDVDGAAAGTRELERLAEGVGAPYLRAVAGYAAGSVLLERSDSRAALARLRRALGLWRELDAPYEMARTSILIGVACRDLGDLDTCDIELASARRILERLGARPVLHRLGYITGDTAPKRGLTGREVEVLRLIATGMTNREIAGDLVISEKTVARHIANIFVKIGVTSRAAATAYAVKSGMA